MTHDKQSRTHIEPGIIAYSSIPCPFGDLWVAAGSRGVVAASFEADEVTFYHEILPLGIPTLDMDGVAPFVAQYEEYFSGHRRAFDLPVDLSRLSPFQRAALQAVAAVPYGTVVSYRDIAERIGKPLAARAVGTALSVNPVTIVIPCHRIIRSDGTAGEYGRTWGERGVRIKLRLLEMEGVTLPLRMHRVSHSFQATR